MKLLFAALLFPLLGLASEKLPEGVSRYKKNIYLSAVPDENLFAAMAKLGVTTAIDLREKEELKGFETDAAKKAGIELVSAPISRSGELDQKQLQAAEELYRKSSKGKVWVYCHSGNRAGAWLAVHLATAEKLSPEAAVSEAKKVGLSREEMAEKVKKYLSALPKKP